MYGKIQEPGLTEIIPFICISAIWGQYPAFLHPEFFRAHCRNWMQADGCWIAGIVLLPGCP